mmetsp:Transcript_19749/g.45976  ORF Transcript_19749/g.45976 Transcript_19749/m.45976 type:complete len:212 (+) Transcript_19749:54-689(+)
MSDTSSFVDPVFLARFGLSRVNLIDYFLHPLNPFRTPNNTSNEVLNMQGISIGMLMQPSFGHIPLSPMAAEEAYAKNLSKLTGEQYELLPPPDPNDLEQYTLPSPLYTIRHVVRTSPNNVKPLGIYYVVEGVIYKSPAIRSLMKSNISRTLDGLAGMIFLFFGCNKPRRLYYDVLIDLLSGFLEFIFLQLGLVVAVTTDKYQSCFSLFVHC